jgi:hypothetical protein
LPLLLASSGLKTQNSKRYGKSLDRDDDSRAEFSFEEVSELSITV